MTVLQTETVYNLCWTRKVMDGSPLTRKVVYGRQTAIQGQGRFTKCDTACSVKGVLVGYPIIPGTLPLHSGSKNLK